MNVILISMLILPFIGGFIAYGIGKKNIKCRDYFVIGISVLEFLFAMHL